MRAVLYRLSRLVRARVGATIVLSLIVAVLVGVTIACAAGARRTASAPDRYIAAAANGFDAQITQSVGVPRLDEIEALPAVADVESATFFFGGVAPHGTMEIFDAIAFTGSITPIGAPFVAGRPPDPARREEVVATKDLVDAHGLSIGDELDVVTLTPTQVLTEGFDAETPDGPTWTARLVGVVDASATLDDTGPILLFSAALLDDPAIAIASSVMWVDEAPGSDLATLRAQLDSLPNGEVFKLTEVLLDDQVRTTVDAQARGLWVLTLVAGVAAIAVLGQLITRQVRLSDADRGRLSAVGFTEVQIVAESTGRAALPIAMGSVSGAALSIASSGAFPTGFVRRIEPTPGVDVDWLALAIGALVFVVALMAWTVIALRLSSRRGRPLRPSPAIEALAVRVPTATAATGLRFAFARRGKDRGSVRGAMAGLILTVGALVGALTFGVSLHRLVDDRARFGNNYDISTDDGSEQVPPETLAILQNDPDVAAAVLYSTAQARAGSETVELLGMEPVRGDIAPRLLEGRLPSAQDEIALGRLTSNDLGAPIDDDVSLVIDGTDQTYRVTGIVVVPSVGGGDGVGHGGVLTPAGLRRLVPDASSKTAFVDVRDDAAPDARARLARSIGVQGGGSDIPNAIVNLRRVQAIPFVLAAVLATLLVLTVAHVMLTSLRNGRRDLAILQSMGADARWITRSMHWQVTAFAIVPVVCGAALGTVAGRMVFRAFADSMGTVNDAAIPFAMICAVGVLALVLSNGTAIVPAGRARRTSTAAVLQAE